MRSRIKVNKLNGSKGGKVTAKKGKEFLESRSRSGGLSLLMKYGSEYFRMLAKKRYKKKKL